MIIYDGRSIKYACIHSFWFYKRVGYTLYSYQLYILPTGLASRRCGQDGLWGEVDSTSCISRVFKDIKSKVSICIHILYEFKAYVYTLVHLLHTHTDLCSHLTQFPYTSGIHAMNLYLPMHSHT